MAHGHGYRRANFLGQFPVLDPRVLARGEMLLFLDRKDLKSNPVGHGSWDSTYINC